MSLEKSVTLLTQLYDARRTVRELYGSQYRAYMAALGKTIVALTESSGRSTLDCTLELAKAPTLKPIERLAVIAAGVELLEPSL